MRSADSTPETRPVGGRGPSRREWLRVGGLGCLGLSLPALFSAPAQAAGRTSRFGRARSCLIVFLTGGPPQHETFDPKPEASSEIRGEYKPIRTSVPGIHFCELLPQVAALAGELAIVRTMTTGTNSHSASGYAMFTGQRHPQASLEVPPDPTDWPALTGVLGKLRPSDRSPLSAVTIPERVVNNPGVPWPGQTGGFLGQDWDPHLFVCDPAAENFRVEALSFPADVSADRFAGRAATFGSVRPAAAGPGRTGRSGPLRRAPPRCLRAVGERRHAGGLRPGPRERNAPRPLRSAQVRPKPALGPAADRSRRAAGAGELSASRAISPRATPAGIRTPTMPDG